MTTESVLVNNHLVMRDHDLTWRWFDVFGPSAVKWSFDASNIVSTTTAAGHTVTATNGTLVGLASVDGGALTMTLGGADNDLLQVQLATEPFSFASAWPAYFGVKFNLVDFDQTDFFAGLTITDTDLDGGVTDGLYFRTVDQAGVLSLVLEKNNNETTAEIVTGVDATAYTVEFFYDGAGYVHAYLNGALVSSTATTNANWPNDENLAPVLCVKAGEIAANHAVIYWARAFQIQET